MTAVFLGIEYFPDPTQGRPVFNGFVFVGEPDEDPEIAANQKQVTLLLQDGSSVDVGQPLRTGAGGVVMYQNSPVRILVDGAFAIKVLNSSSKQVYYVPNNVGFIDASDVSYTSAATVEDRLGNTGVADYIEFRAIIIAELQDNDPINVAVRLAGFNGGGGPFVWSATNLTAEVTSDPQGGKYVASNSDITGGLGAWVRVRDGDEVYLEDFGIFQSATGTANSSAFAGMKTFLDANTGIIRGQKATYAFDAEVIIDGSRWNIDLNDAVFDFSAATGTISNQACLTIEGAGVTQIESLNVSASAGDKSIELTSSPSLVAGDLILLHDPTDFSYTGFRVQNQKGEFQVVDAVSGSTVTLRDGLRLGYGSSPTIVYIVAIADGYWKNFSVIGAGGNNVSDNSATDISFRYCRGAIDNVDCGGSDNTSMTFDMCYELHGTNLGTKQVTDINTFNTNYGFRFNSSDKCTASGDFTGFRHGIDCGPVSGVVTGGIRKICISCTWVNSTCTGNLSLLNVNAANVHGAQEGCGMDNVHVYGGGVGYSGNQFFFKGGSINVPTLATIAPIYTPFELSGFDHILGTADTVVNYYSDVNMGSGRQLIDIGNQVGSVLDANTLYGGVTRISGQINAPNATGDFVRFENRGYTGDKYGISFRDLKLNAPNIGEIIDFDAGTGDDPEFAEFSNVDPGGVTLYVAGAGSVTTKIRGLRVAGTETITVTNSSDVFTTAVVLPTGFGKNPNVQITGEGANVGGDPYNTFYQGISATGFTVGIQTSDGGNFAAGDTASVSWVAELNEY